MARHDSSAVSNALDPPRSQHVRPILRYVDENARNGDILFVHRRAQYALRYYGECDDCRPWSGDFPWPLRPAAAPPGQYQPALESVPPLMLVQSTSEGDRILDNFREVDGLPRDRRIWFLFTHPETRRGLDEEQMFLSYLDLNGRRLDERIGEDASLYLYTLNRRYG